MLQATKDDYSHGINIFMPWDVVVEIFDGFQALSSWKNLYLWAINAWSVEEALWETRMHCSRMRTVRCTGRLSWHACPPFTHVPLSCMSPCHACPLPHTPYHTCPPPHAPPAMHAPCHVHLRYTCPAMHSPYHKFPYHAFPPPCTPPPQWTEGMTHACENITFPQLLLRA